MNIPIRIIAGLGNPTRPHERDRHNAGFWFVERYAQKLGISLTKEPKYHAIIGKTRGDGGDVWLVMPQTYMNLSGKSVGALARFFKITPPEILVVHDELDFAPGTAKLKQGGGVAGHNGLKDIAAQLASQDFWRIRVGIGHPGDRNLVADWVLASPSPTDRESIDATIDRGLAVMPHGLSGDMTAAMRQLHAKPAVPKTEPPKKPLATKD